MSPPISHITSPSHLNKYYRVVIVVVVAEVVGQLSANEDLLDEGCNAGGLRVLLRVHDGAGGWELAEVKPKKFEVKYIMLGYKYLG